MNEFEAMHAARQMGEVAREVYGVTDEVWNAIEDAARGFLMNGANGVTLKDYARGLHVTYPGGVVLSVTIFQRR